MSLSSFSSYTHNTRNTRSTRSTDADSCRGPGNINDSTDKSRYWAHSFVCVIISCLVYGLVWHLRKYLIACKVRWR